MKSDFVDAVVTVHGGVFGSEENPPHTSVLYIREAKGDKIVLAGPSDHSMMTIRKRMATPATTPMALYMLKKFSGEEGAVEPACNDPEGEAEFYAHLQVWMVQSLFSSISHTREISQISKSSTQSISNLSLVKTLFAELKYPCCHRLP